jgi:hypothetical protein
MAQVRDYCADVTLKDLLCACVRDCHANVNRAGLGASIDRDTTKVGYLDGSVRRTANDSLVGCRDRRFADASSSSGSDGVGG